MMKWLLYVMQLNEKGQVVAISQLLNELGSLEEETGLKCCICLEGYRSHPQKVGVHSYHITTLY